MNFIISGKKILLSWVFWIMIWQITANMINIAIFLPSPSAVVVAFCELLFTSVFWKSVGFTVMRIGIGFLAGVVSAVLLGGIAYKNEMVEVLLTPVILTMKSVPVASFSILVLIWFSSKNLSILISYLMVLPVVYTNILEGLKNMERDLIEMVQVFQVGVWNRIKFLYVLQVYSYFKSGIMIALGLCFKAGIAAEVIGLPKYSIGEQIYQSKIYLNTANLFAWTIVVIIMSLLFEKMVIWCFDCVIRKIEQG